MKSYLQDPQKADLGRYAHEDKMPDRLVSLLRRGRYINSEGKQALDIRARLDQDFNLASLCQALYP